MLTRKNDFIVWLHLSQAQLKIYTDFVKLDEIKEVSIYYKSTCYKERMIIIYFIGKSGISYVHLHVKGFLDQQCLSTFWDN